MIATVSSARTRHPWLSHGAALGIAMIGTFGIVRGARLTVPYLIIVIGLGALVVRADERVRFSTPALVGLTLWGMLHLVGGLVELDDGRIFYNTLFTRWIHFDNVVHLLGFGSAGLVGYECLVAALGTPMGRRAAWMVTCTAALGAGALNEVVEFAATHVLAATEVGGYQNTGRDLVANLIGGALAATWVAAHTKADRAPAEPKGVATG